MAMDIITQMKRFVEPESVAIFGVSRTPMPVGSGSVDILSNLINGGYQGKIYPVHPHTDEIQGLKTYSSIAEVPGSVDLAVINLPRNKVPTLVKECINKDIKAIIIETQGFHDANDDEGKQLQQEIYEHIKGTGTRILGPNTLGTANAFIDFSSAFLETQMEKIPIGFICQTGVFFLGLAGLKLMGKAVDLGNSSDIDISDSLEYLGFDDDIKVIGMHIEGVRNAAKFFNVARRITCRKPVVALKTGKSEEAAKAAQSHTGTIAGGSQTWDSVLRQAGVINVEDIEELGDTLRAFYKLPPMRGRRIGLISFTGGFGVMGLDACQKFGLKVAQFSSETINRLSALYPPWQDIGNPADIGPGVMVNKMVDPFDAVELAISTLLGDPGVDAVLGIFGAFDPLIGHAYYKIAEKAMVLNPEKPLIFYFYGPCGTEAMNELALKDKVMAFPSPMRAIRALGHLADYSDFLRKP